MTLPENQRAIIAGFRTMADAEKTKQQLKNVGVIDLQIERISLYPIDKLNDRRYNPITGDFPGLANALFEQSTDRDTSILRSADPSSSGMADGNDETIGLDVLLTVVVSLDQFDQAEQIVRTNGGVF